MKDTKGITLIALIITIIVMLILVGVTVTTAINGGLFTAAQEAKFKTEVSQIQESLQVQKAVLLANSIGTLESVESISLNELDIDEKLKTNFSEKLIILKQSGDFVLCYNSGKVTNQEKEWLEELGIHANKNFREYIEYVAEINKNGEGYIGLEELAVNINNKYPKACIAYGLANQLTTPEDIGDIFGEDNANSENSFINYIKLYASLGNYNLEINSKGEVTDLNTAEDGGGIILMSEEEANKIIRLGALGSTYGATGLELPTYEIISYIGEQTQKVKLPNVIYDSETGTKTKIITKIGEKAFDPTTTAFVSILTMMGGMDEDTYKNTLTVAELYQGMTGNIYEGSNGTSTDVSVKNAVVKEFVKSTYNVGEEYITITNDIPYAYFDSQINQIVPRAKVKVGKVILPSCISNIGSNAFANQDAMSELVYWSNKVTNISNSAFAGCTNLSKLTFKEINQIYLSGTTGYSTVWGAPNADNIKIVCSNQQ